MIKKKFAYEPCRHDETLFLEIHYQTCLPELIILTDEGANVIDFGNVLIGQSFIKTVTIQNISSRDVEVDSFLY